MQSLKGTGWVPERRHIQVAGRLAAAARPAGTLLSPERGGFDSEPWFQDQDTWGACTGHGGSLLYYDLTGEKVSSWMLWQYGLVRDGADPENLPNDGVRTSAMLAAFRRHGACAYEAWNPSVPGFDHLSLPPPILAIKAQRRNLDVAACYATGTRLVALVVDALARKHSVGITVRVDRRYDRAGAEPIGPEEGTIRGLHFVTVRHFERRGGAYIFDSPSSWGTGHGDGGMVRLTAERLGQSPFACFAKGYS